MSESVICAEERAEKPNKVRRQGFIPGVIYGRDVKSTRIKLDQKEFNKLLQGHAKNTKVKVKFGNEVKDCIVKEVQKHHVNGQILHVDLQTIHSDDKIRLKVPIVFQGKEQLAQRHQLLQVLISEVEIMGKAADMPEFVSIDVGNKKVGDRITVKDFHVGNGLKILDEESEVFAVITATKEYSEESVAV